MSEFLEYIRGLHTKLCGNKAGKKDKPKDQILEHDSISEVTDLSEAELRSLKRVVIIDSTWN